MSAYKKPKITVEHVKDFGKSTKLLDEGEGLYVYCGRPSKFSNPFVISDKLSREDVIQLFTEHLPKKAIQSLAKVCIIHDTKHLRLGCYCQSSLGTVKENKPCHCEAIKEELEKIFDE